MGEQIRVLQALRLKGRATADGVAAATGAAAEQVLPALVASGHVEEARDRFKLTADGRARLERLLKEERLGIDREALTAAYHAFDGHNAKLKTIITDWQLVDGVRPNDHSDPAYDGAVVQRLTDLHEAFVPLLERFVSLAPRLAPYQGRFESALVKVVAGEYIWLARPLIDSYHTVWFELHEDLIGLAGLSRAAEASAGRAE